MNGVLVVDKPGGMTSANVVARVKRALGAKRVGHTGTLDPMATGVLPIVVGEGTKIAAFLLADDKAYDGELELGISTDTLDIEGEVVARAESAAISAVSREGLETAMRAWVGDCQQIPPMYSALKKDGRRLYELARKGEEVEREPRSIRIAHFDLLDFTPPRARFSVACTKGTYVRSLVRDVGEALGCGATLTGLRRTRAGLFDLSQAVPLDQVNPTARVVSPGDAIAHLPTLVMDDSMTAAVRHGKHLPAPEGFPQATPIRLLTPERTLAAVAEIDGLRLRYLRVFS